MPHSNRFDEPITILIIVLRLNNSKRIYPDVSDEEMARDGHKILECLR